MRMYCRSCTKCITYCLLSLPRYCGSLAIPSCSPKLLSGETLLPRTHGAQPSITRASLTRAFATSGVAHADAFLSLSCASSLLWANFAISPSKTGLCCDPDPALRLRLPRPPLATLERIRWIPGLVSPLAAVAVAWEARLPSRGLSPLLSREDGTPPDLSVIPPTPLGSSRSSLRSPRSRTGLCEGEHGLPTLSAPKPPRTTIGPRGGRSGVSDGRERASPLPSFGLACAACTGTVEVRVRPRSELSASGSGSASWASVLMPRVGAGDDAVDTGRLALRRPGRSRRCGLRVRLGPERELRRLPVLLALEGPELLPGVGDWKLPAIRFSMSSTCVRVRGTRSRSTLRAGESAAPLLPCPLPLDPATLPLPCPTLAGGVQLSSARRKA